VDASHAVLRQPLGSTNDPRGWDRWIRWRSVAIVEFVWVAFALVFSPLALPGGDATYAYAFLRALFGEQSNTHTGYQAGLSYFETPFYALGKLLAWLGASSLLGRPTAPAVIALGMIVYTGITILVAFWIARALGLPFAALVVLASIFGTSVFFYGTFSPGQTHVVDALLATLTVALALGAFRRRWDIRWLTAAGAAIGVAASVRYFDGLSMAAALGIVLIFERKIRAMIGLALATAGTFGLMLVPIALVGVPLFGGGFSPQQEIGWEPGAPLKMLVTIHRGVFIWTPLVVLGFIGLARLARARPQDRPFHTFLALSAVILLALFTTSTFWDAGWSFSNRYLTQFFPLVVVGVGGLADWRPRLTGAVAAVAVAWSVFLGLSLATVQVFTVTGESAWNVARPVLSGRTSPGAFAYGLYRHSVLLTRVARL
jgi:hypothetical protein